MVGQEQAREPTKGNAPSTATPSGSAGTAAVQLKQSLASQSFDIQMKMLSPVQQKGEGGADPSSVQEAAAAGVAGSGRKLPHAERIQAAFGRHDVSGIQAHTGGKAAKASAAMGAEAYATGDQIAFKDAPDLHTAAHEAAHVVQQKHGVSLAGGVGKVGDSYEQHADRVADKVVRGESAEGELDTMAGGSRNPQVQRRAITRLEPVQMHRAPVQMRGGKAENYYGTFDLSGTGCTDAHVFDGEVSGTDPKGLHAYTNGAAPGGVTILATVGNTNSVHLVIWTKGAAAGAARAKWSSMFPTGMSRGMVCWYIQQRAAGQTTPNDQPGGFDQVKQMERPGTGWSGISLGKAGATIYPLCGASYTAAPGYNLVGGAPHVNVGGTNYRIVNP